MESPDLSFTLDRSTLSHFCITQNTNATIAAPNRRSLLPNFHAELSSIAQVKRKLGPEGMQPEVKQQVRNAGENQITLSRKCCVQN